MRIVIATPLFPPDIAGQALYSKELARRLAVTHEVVVLAYGHLPEKVAGVRYVSVPKNRISPVRLLLCTLALLYASKKTDAVYVQNGPSMEIPAGIVAHLVRTPFIVGLSDTPAYERSKRNKLLKFFISFITSASVYTVTHIPAERPEILPFRPRPDAALEEYEKTWQKHLHTLEELFRQYAK